MTDSAPISAAPGHFITGTDTEVGKTLVCCALLQRLREAGRPAVAMKPVAAGSALFDGRRGNEDAVALRRLVTPAPPYERINPYLFDPPIAPHIAAERLGIVIDPGVIEGHYRYLRRHYSPVLVEGAGGWLVPLGPGLTMADLARRLGLPVILVVAIRLGCINHALLTVESIAAHGLSLAGWVATFPRPYEGVGSDIVASLETRIPAPLLAVLPHDPDMTVARAAAHFEDIGW
ncbi:MAG: dethiobiotin synthase [Gammaproteobacteria bacterium]|nr:dethiobiotin synthase [Gammaproteobacteria bacterium]